MFAQGPEPFIDVRKTVQALFCDRLATKGQVCRKKTPSPSIPSKIVPPNLNDLYFEHRQSGSPPRTLWITGHSLGGALARLSAAYARQAGVPVQGIYTFGSPRMGDRGFKQEYTQNGLAEKTYRMINNHDPVPRVPPPILYMHVGALHSKSGCMRFVHLTTRACCDARLRAASSAPTLYTLI